MADMRAGDVVLGLGGCLDYEVTWDPAVLEDLVRGYGIRAAEVDRDALVRSERDLVRSVLGFMRDGVGGERFVASSDIVAAFAARLPCTTTLGGTPVRAALALARLGVPSTVHLVSIDDQVRRLLPDVVAYLCSATRDSVDPHLIVQFPAGASVRAGDVDVVAPAANRLIYVNDRPNRELVISPDLAATLATARAFLISGFNSMQDPATVAARVRDLREQMAGLSADAVVVYEDAGFHVPELSAAVRAGLLDVVDVYSMNEDEMQGHVGRRVDLTDARDVARALEELHAAVPAATLVVHTSRWSLAFGHDAGRYGDALELGVTVAGARYLHGDDVHAEDHESVVQAPPHPAGRILAAGLEALLPGRVRVVAGRDLRPDRPTTIGLGDSFVGGFVAALAGARTGRAGSGSVVAGRAG